MPNPPNNPDENWPLTWAAVEEAQLRDCLRLTPAQRLAWAEELLALVQLAESRLPKS